MSKIILRSATIDDAAEMLKIYAPFITDSSISFEYEVPGLKEFHDRILETQKHFPWLVCEVDGQIAGYAYAQPYRTRAVYAWSTEATVYVGEKFRKKNIATQLYTKLFALLKEQGVVNVFAVITQPNDPSVRFHESMGFTYVGTFADVGFKQGQWWGVGWWQLQLQRPNPPQALKPPQLKFY